MVGSCAGEVGEGGGDVAAEEIEIFVEAEGGEFGVESDEGGVEGMQKWKKQRDGEREEEGGEGVGKSGLRAGGGGVIHAYFVWELARS